MQIPGILPANLLRKFQQAVAFSVRALADSVPRFFGGSNLLRRSAGKILGSSVEWKALCTTGKTFPNGPVV